VTAPRPNRILAELPTARPFIAAEAHERAAGRPLTLRLGANESLLGPSPKVSERVARALGEAPLYGDPENHDLREALAERHGVDATQIMVGAGIDDLLGMTVRCFSDPGDVGVVSRGTYPMFAYNLKGFGGEVHKVDYESERPDSRALAAAACERSARLVYLANPDNPTGALLPTENIEQLIDALPDGTLLILDEAYADYTDPAELLPLRPILPGLVRLRTFSKIHGLAGLRVGYAIAPKQTLDVLEKIRLHFAVNRLGQIAALAALSDVGHTDRVREEVRAGRDHFTEIGRRLGLPALPSRTNFVAFDTGDAARAESLRSRLLEAGAWVRIPWAPPLDRFIRVSVPDREGRDRFGVALRSAIEGC